MLPNPRVTNRNGLLQDFIAKRKRSKQLSSSTDDQDTVETRYMMCFHVAVLMVVDHRDDCGFNYTPSSFSLATPHQ
jgi:hypothetical protein